MERLLTFLKNKERDNTFASLSICVVITLVLLMCNMLFGASGASFSEIISAIIQANAENSHISAIVYFVRIPRILSCIICGGALAVSGLLIQTVLHTPLASPGIIGVNAGSGFAVVLVSCLFPAAYISRMIAAFLGAFIAVILVYTLAKKTGASKLTIVLSGIAVSSLLTAFTDVLITINPNAIMDRSAFSVGGFSGVGMKQVLLATPVVVIVMIVILAMDKNLEVLTMGDEVAASLGVNVSFIRFMVLLCAAVLAACAVSIGGLIGFVGLIAPHISRILFKTSFKKLTLFSFWFGSILILLCDLLARLLFKPFEIPTGIVISCIGAPFFLFLLLKKRR